MRYSRKLVIGVIGAAVILAVSATTLAASFTHSSGPDVEQHFISQNAAAIIPTTTGWHDIPNTTFTVTVPDTHHRVAHMTFSGESRCTDASWCSVRAVATSAATGATIELEPSSGSNFAFDSGGQRGARSFSRVANLSGGSEGIQYTFKLQAQIIGGSSSSVFRLDDYVTQLEMSNQTN
ncbi:MAG TPA: hypothetical protein VLH86_05220 [Patescibacteria group bacterium]|nr:hypothetical protein [Patescibacteria group bacterium]